LCSNAVHHSTIIIQLFFSTCGRRGGYGVHRFMLLMSLYLV